MRRLGIVAVTLLAAAACLLAGRELERFDAQRAAGKELLYLPNGKYLRVASMGQAPLLADLFYLWALQYYSIYDRDDRFHYVEHVFGNVIAELDPHYVDAYWMGALILSVEADDLEAALRLLDTGYARNPAAWTLPYIAGWECYHARQFERAREYFRVAAETPGAPVSLRRMQIGLASKLGDYRAAIDMWTSVIEDPQADEQTLAIAGRQLRRLKINVDLGTLRRAIDAFRSENARAPASLAELRARSYIDVLPRDPDDRDYAYDPAAGEVSTAAGRVLGASR